MKVSVGDLLEVVGAGALTAAGTVGGLHAGLWLGATVGLLLGAASLVYFGQVFQDIQVTVRRPHRRAKASPVSGVPDPSRPVLWCAVCGKDTTVSHAECNKVQAQTAATFRR